MRTVRVFLGLTLATGLGLSTPLATQSAAPPGTFAAPVRLKAGDKFLGENRLFPSPTFHDVNGDGLLDIVVGDLPGRLTIALRQAGQPITYAAETKLQDGEGKDIDFHNW